jgi:alpha-glucosidase
MRSAATHAALLAATLLLTPLGSTHASTNADQQVVRSPNGRLVVTVAIGEALSWTVEFEGQPLLGPASLSMTLGDGRSLGEAPHLLSAEMRSVDETMQPIIPVKTSTVRNTYSELVLDFGDYDLIIRAYDDAAAYRFRTRLQGEITVRAEEVAFAFGGDHRVYFPREDGFVSHNERTYQERSLASIAEGELASLPTLVAIEGGPKVLVTEADLRSYPGLWLEGTGTTTLRGTLPAYVLEEKMTNDRDSEVVRRADYLARTTGTRSFPWRVAVVAARDADLLENQTVYLLSGEIEIDDTSWIRPGKVAWDWWNANNLFGVDFEAGVNTATYQHYIDFAARFGIEYIVLDEGWYVLGDLLTTAPDMDVPRLFDYAAEKGVEIIPWVVWKTLEDQLEPALEQFERWGAAGIKVDFMQRDDQRMVEYYETVARAAAKRHLLVDFHGAYKPAGLSRRFPNVITREGVKGLEHSKWSDEVTPEHDVTLPFIRMVTGPMDYTPGAMVNAQKESFRDIFRRPMSQGTRCHQLAMFVVYESPLQMLADSPAHYGGEPEAMDLLATVPTVWDETIALDARVADYLLMARRRDAEWYVAAMTDWQARELELDFSFLPKGSFRLDIWRDGPNASRYGSDFQRLVRTVSNRDIITIRLAPGGGWVGRLTESDQPTATAPPAE